MISPPQAGPRSDGGPAFSLTLHGPSGPVKAGSDILLRVTITNLTDHDLNFVTEPGPAFDQPLSYDISLRDENGRQAPPTALLRSLREQSTQKGWRSNSGYALAPGKSHEEELAITKFYDLLTPGKYTIQVSRRQIPNRSQGDSVNSNIITITITEPEVGGTK
jgi:hypothetical protein